MEQFRYVLEGAMIESWWYLFHLLPDTIKRNNIRKI